MTRRVDRDYFRVEAVDNAVNEVQLVEAATGEAPEVEAVGSDTNIDLKLTPKGSGEVLPNYTSATNHHVVMCSRNTIAYTDTTNKTLFVIPANAIIIDWILDITTLFDGTTPQIVVGTTSADPDEYVDDLAAGTAGMNRCGDASDMPDSGRGSVGSSAITVLGKFKVAGGTPSQGAATIEVFWIMA